MKSIKQNILYFLSRYFKYYHFLHSRIVILYKKKNTSKVFCIGWAKTGTSTLRKALNILGYRTVQFLRGGREPKEGWPEYITKSNYGAYVDWPMFKVNFFKKIDKKFPNSKFILTIRDEKSWEKSYRYYFDESPEEVKIAKQKMIKHNNNVITYFKHNPNQLLIVNIAEGDGWEKLCPFLDKPIPKKPFPHKNVGVYKNKIR
ncbi:MAG: sulfotransferase family protein [Promethearchaeota archaeon]